MLDMYGFHSENDQLAGVLSTRPPSALLVGTVQFVKRQSSLTFSVSSAYRFLLVLERFRLQLRALMLEPVIECGTVAVHQQQHES